MRAGAQIAQPRPVPSPFDPSSNNDLLYRLQDHQQKDQDQNHEDAHHRVSSPTGHEPLPYSELSEKQVPQGSALGHGGGLNLSDTRCLGRYCKAPAAATRAARVEVVMEQPALSLPVPQPPPAGQKNLPAFPIADFTVLLALLALTGFGVYLAFGPPSQGPHRPVRRSRRLSPNPPGHQLQARARSGPRVDAQLASMLR